MIEWTVLDDETELAEAAAGLMLDAIRRRPDIVLGLPTGRTPLGMYAAVVRHCGVEQHCFRDVVTFNLDEYVGIDPEHPASYHTYMQRVLFDSVDLQPENTHIPDGSGRRVLSRNPELPMSEALLRECEDYERAIARHGSLDLTFLGLGTNGHIGFNEPGTPFDSRTHIVTLAVSTREANAPHFPPGSTPPEQAITVGIGTILESSEIILLASGEGKRPAIERLRTGEQDPSFPASALHAHGRVRCLVDRAAAGR